MTPDIKSHEDVNFQIVRELGGFAYDLKDFAIAHGYTVDTQLIELVKYLIDREGDPECDRMRNKLFEFMVAFDVSADKSVRSMQRRLWAEIDFLHENFE